MVILPEGKKFRRNIQPLQASCVGSSSFSIGSEKVADVSKTGMGIYLTSHKSRDEVQRENIFVLSAPGTEIFAAKMITGLHHVNLIVPAGTLDAAEAFYGKTLGLTPRAVPERQKGSLAWCVHHSFHCPCRIFSYCDFDV